MARPAVRVLPFPVPAEMQLDAFPFGSPDTVRLHMDRTYARLTGLAPLLDPQGCVRLLGELALVEQLIDKLHAEAKFRVERDARRVGLIA